MPKMTLQQAVDRYNYAQVAKHLGCSPPAVRKALAFDRDITVWVTGKGETLKMTAVETSAFPGQIHGRLKFDPAVYRGK